MKTGDYRGASFCPGGCSGRFKWDGVGTLTLGERFDSFRNRGKQRSSGGCEGGAGWGVFGCLNSCFQGGSNKKGKKN